MSFKRLDAEDIVLSSELITFPTWIVNSETGSVDTAEISSANLVRGESSGRSTDYYTDYYSAVGGQFDTIQSKCMFSVAYAEKPTSESVGNPSIPNIIYGQYRSLVLGDEDSEFRFGSGRKDLETVDTASGFFAISIDRARFREKIDPTTCRITFGSAPEPGEESEGKQPITLAPDITTSERYIDAGRVYELAKYAEDENKNATYSYPDSNTSYGYFLSDIGVILINADLQEIKDYSNTEDTNEGGANADANMLIQNMSSFILRSQETITSNYIFARARNAEFNYSTNPSNITGSAGNIRWGSMINQPQAFITTVGLYNDSNECVAVAKLSRPLVKDFTKEALIRIKIDY